MNTRPTTYVPGQFLRPCDVCGIRFLSGELVRGADGKYRCKRWCTEKTLLEIDNEKAEARKRSEAPPPPYAIPWERDDLAAEEGSLFQALAEWQIVDANGGTRTGLAPEAIARRAGPRTAVAVLGFTVEAAAWVCIYLGAIVVENKRPYSWMASAKAKLRELGDYLLSKQCGPTGTGDDYLTDTTAPWYGGWVRAQGPRVRSADVGIGCMALTRAYQATGDQRYLDGAGRAVVCINRLMNGDKLTDFYESSDSDGVTRHHFGMVTHEMVLAPPEDGGGGGGEG